MELWNRATSSASYRARLALSLKGLTYKYNAITTGAAQRTEDYLELNPQGLVPVLILEGGNTLTQTTAIIEYLDEKYPKPNRLLPDDPIARARVRAIAQHIACEMQPLNNQRTQKFITNALAVDKAGLEKWIRHWLNLGFEGLEAMLESPETGTFCHGNTPTMADCFLVPQVRNALLRTPGGYTLDAYPTIQRIYDALLALPEIQEAMPERQPDFVP